MISNNLWVFQDGLTLNEQIPHLWRIGIIYGLEAFILQKWHKVDFKC